VERGTFGDGCFFRPLEEEMFTQVSREGSGECKGVDQDRSLEVCRERARRLRYIGKNERCEGYIVEGNLCGIRRWIDE